MHPGPINRGVEITSDVADSQQSVILGTSGNGVAVRMAVIYLLVSARLKLVSSIKSEIQTNEKSTKRTYYH